MFEWECIGKFFNSETDINDLFHNDSYIVLEGNGDFNFGSYLASNSTSYLSYYLDLNKTDDNSLPSKITFKLRLSEYGHFKSIINFINDIYIKYENVYDTFVPCFVCSGNANDLYMPFINDIIGKEWCDVELLWHSGICTLSVNGKILLSALTDNIISSKKQNIALRDDDFFINFEISDLCFYRIAKTNYYKPIIKILKTDLTDSTKLTVYDEPYIYSSQSITISGFKPESNMTFRTIFSSLPEGLSISTENISIDGCTFKRDVIASSFTDCRKIYTDNLTGEEITLRLYVYPNVEHNEKSTELLSKVFHYYKNIDSNDVFIADIDIIQNNVNLCGRNITWKSSADCYVTNHLVRHILHDEFEDGVASNVKMSINVRKVKGAEYPLIAGIDFDGLELVSKNGSEITLKNPSDDRIIVNHTFGLLSIKGNNIPLVEKYDSSLGVNKLNYEYYRRRNDTGFVQTLSFVKGLLGNYDPILNTFINISDLAEMINFKLHLEYFTPATLESIEVQLIAVHEGTEYVVSSCNYGGEYLDSISSKDFYVDFKDSTISEIS